MKQKFLIHLNNFHAKELFHKGRANDSMSLKIFFDDHTFHTNEKHSGSSGEADWSFHKSFVYKVPVGELNHLHLEGRVLRIVCMQGHRGEYGEVLVDLYTLATGPQDHDLPLLNLEKQVVGRLSFTVVMEQFCEMKATFVFLKVKNLFPLPGHQRVHPYLRYGHSTTWREYGTFEESVVFDGHENPEWWDLFPLFFATSLSRLSRESIDVAVCHHGTFTDGEYGHVNLIFARPGKKLITEGMECHFEGPLKYGNAAIEGKIILTGVPRYAQMIPKSSIQKCVHTETGVYNAVPLLIGLPLPKCPIIEVEDHQDHVEEDHDAKMHQVPPLEDEIHKDLHEDLPEQTKNKLAQAKELNASRDSQHSTGSHSSHKHHKHNNKDNNNDKERKQQEQQHLTEVSEPQKEDLIDLQTPPDSKKDPKSLNAMFWRSASNNYVHL